jgi:hypothetical protein
LKKSEQADNCHQEVGCGSDGFVDPDAGNIERRFRDYHGGKYFY